MIMKRKYLILMAFTGFFVALDQVTKLYIHTHFLLHESYPIFKGFFDLTYIRNTGAAFGLFGESHPIFRNIFFLSMPLIATVIIITILHSLPDHDKIQTIALSAICGGALGNYVDRLRLGYVVDFLDFHIQNKYSWPAFNIADVAIIIGVGVLILATILEAKKNN